jgi:hypothetical protein
LGEGDGGTGTGEEELAATWQGRAAHWVDGSSSSNFDIE